MIMMTASADTTGNTLWGVGGYTALISYFVGKVKVGWEKVVVRKRILSFICIDSEERERLFRKEMQD